MTRIAVVDLGSYSTRLLIAETEEDGALRELDRQLTITRLAESVDSEAELQETAIKRVRGVLRAYMRSIKAHRAERALAVATSAVRDARNGPDFLEALEREFGIETELLSGEQEAALSFRGATLGRSGQASTLLVDIGGGSTEYVFGSSGAIELSRSLDLGCVRLTERFLEHDPPTVSELDDCRSFVQATLSEIIPASVPASAAVGVAGTVTTLATLNLALDSEVPELIHGHRLSKRRIQDELNALAKSTVSELRSRPGIHPDRASVIVAGTLVLVETLAHFDLEEIEVSECDLLHGVALVLAERA